MRQITIFSFFLVSLSSVAFAQDAYHISLQNLLQNTYGLPAQQDWILPNTESATFNISTNYGGSTTVINPAAQSFTLGRRRVVAQGANPWDAGHLYPSQAAVAAGDKCLIVFWMRSADPGAKLSLFAEHHTTYEKEALVDINVSTDWVMYAVPFESQAGYAAGSLNIGLHLAWNNQTIEIAGAACLNYKNTVSFSDLPALIGDITYDGISPDAPWRAEAAAAIEQLRKANLSITVLDGNGQAASGVSVRVEMLQHDFKFGSAVVSNLFNGGSAQNNIYEEKLTNLDGFGHGFNEVVFENDLKWPAWEQTWLSEHAEIADDVTWLLNQGISIRGHNLAWPGWNYSPSDINESQTPAYIKNRIWNHITDLLEYPGVGTACADWDAINEITQVTDYANHFAGTPNYTTGRELYKEIFDLAKSLAPNSTLYLNDYVAIEQADSPINAIELWKSRIDELIAAGAPIEGLGFQGHFSLAPTGIPRVKAVLDDFWNTYGLPAKVTEYDIHHLAPQTIQAQYMRDILTITFAHPSMNGFLMWGFWDGAHWLGNAPLFNTDWTLKPSGEAFVDQVFNQWWTDETLLSNGEVLSLNGYKGKYRITVQCADGSTYENRINLLADTSLVLQPNCIVGTEQAHIGYGIKIMPNPASDFIYFNWKENLLPDEWIGISVWRADGVQVYKEKLNGHEGHFQIPISNWIAGLYTVVIMDTSGQTFSKIIQICH